MNRLEFKRHEAEARHFEVEALTQIWKKGNLSGQYTPDPISEYRLEAAHLDSGNINLSVVFFIFYNDIKNLEIAIANPANGSFDYGGQIPFLVDEEPVSLEFLDPIVENSSVNGFRIISTLGEGERVIWSFDPTTGMYNRN